MKLTISAAVLAVSFAASSAQAAPTQTLVLPYGESDTKPVPHNPVSPDDTPEEIAKDAARDLKDSSFYNRPGATRAQYDADWQTCRLIARGSRTPAGVSVMSYNPALMSPLAAGLAGGLASGIGQAIAEGQQRRANRRSCLMYKGWRRVELTSARAAEVGKMSDADREAYINSVIGADTVEGTITELTTFHLPADAAIRLDAPLAGPATMAVKGKQNPLDAIVPAENEGVVVMAFSRPDINSAGRSGQVTLVRYNMEAHDVAYRPTDWKKQGDTTTYSYAFDSKDRKAPYELHVVRLTAGQYVIANTAAGPGNPIASNCFGAPLITVPAGKVVYLGDWQPILKVQLSTGKQIYGVMGWIPQLEQARTNLANFQPALAAQMENADIRNGATYSCAAITMSKWELPGLPQLEAASDPVMPAVVPATTSEPVQAVLQATSETVEAKPAETEVTAPATLPTS